MFVPVQDGDAPKPAGDPRILLDGWDYKADTHETLNTFTWGPDGALYVATSNRDGRGRPRPAS